MPISKIVTLEELKNKIKEKNGARVVFTNGCFDLLHVGHVRLLRQARARGDLLVVGLNSDSSVRRLKGPDRAPGARGMSGPRCSRPSNASTMWLSSTMRTLAGWCSRYARRCW